MYQTITIQVHRPTGTSKKNDTLYAYCFGFSRAVNNMYNTALFVQRQVLTAVEKPEAQWSDNEREVMESIRDTLPLMGAKYRMPTKGRCSLSYGFLNAYFSKSGNKDYFCSGFSRQSAQHTLKDVSRAMKGFFSSLREYKKNPGKYTGKPKLPGYRTSGGLHTVLLTNQDCVLNTDDDRRAWVKLPKAEETVAYTKQLYKEQQEALVPGEQPEHRRGSPAVVPNVSDVNPKKLSVLLGSAVPSVEGARLKQVTIKPYQGSFYIQCNIEVPDSEPAISAGEDCPDMIPRLVSEAQADGSVGPVPEVFVPKRVVCIDMGVNNLAAMTNNVGLPCMLFKGGAVKSVNQYYNKRMAQIKSEQTKGSAVPFNPTPESERLCTWRNNWMNDVMHKTARIIVDWCRTYEIDTLIVGKNKFWKQEADNGPVNNQNFVSIPFSRLCGILEYLCERYHIHYVEQEESYTSKASFLDGDDIPTYTAGDTKKYEFSGRRAPMKYHGHTKPIKKGKKSASGFHGLYKTANGTVVNADLQASANIGRKAFPDVFKNGIAPDFNSVVVVQHPDDFHCSVKINGQAQKDAHIPSKSKRRRDFRRAMKEAQAQNQTQPKAGLIA